MRGHDLHHYLAGCTLVGEGLTAGMLFRAGRYPALTAGDGVVHGEMYAMSDPPALLEALDELEEYDPLHPETSAYVRRLCDVRIGDHVLRAWVYAYNRDTSELAPIEGGDWRSAAGT